MANITYHRRRFLIASTAAVLAGSGRSAARAAAFQYRIGMGEPVESPLALAATQFAAAVLRESGGRLQFSVFPNSMLGGSTAMLGQVRLGALQCLLTGGDLLSAVAPVAGIERVGFAFQTSQAGLSAMNGALGSLIRSELQAKNFFLLDTFWEAGFRQITTSTHPIRSVADLSGLKLRVPASAIASDLFKTLGASPVSLNANEMYTGLQTHIVDAMEGTFANILSYRVFEVQRFVSVTNHQWNGFWFVLNGDAWNALPGDLQTIVRRNAARYGRAETRDSELLDRASEDKIKRLGLQLNTPASSLFRAPLGDYYARWKREFGSNAWSLLENYAGKLG